MTHKYETIHEKNLCVHEGTRRRCYFSFSFSFFLFFFFFQAEQTTFRFLLLHLWFVIWILHFHTSHEILIGKERARLITKTTQANGQTNPALISLKSVQSLANFLMSPLASPRLRNIEWVECLTILLCAGSLSHPIYRALWSDLTSCIPSDIREFISVSVLMRNSWLSFIYLFSRSFLTTADFAKNLLAQQAQALKNVLILMRGSHTHTDCAKFIKILSCCPKGLT